MQGPRGAFTLICLQLLVGIFFLMWTTSVRWRFINRGYYRSTTWVMWPLTAATSFLLAGRLRTLDVVTAALMLAYLLAVYSQRPALEWSTGAAACLFGLWLVAAAGSSACGGGCGFGALHGLIGMLVVGGVAHAMVLGHWYLNQARLPIEPLQQQTALMFLGLAGSAVLGAATRSRLLDAVIPGAVFTFSAAGYWWVWALLVTATAGLGIMVWATVKQHSTQSATGLLYVAIVTALGAQFILNLLVAGQP